MNIIINRNILHKACDNHFPHAPKRYYGFVDSIATKYERSMKTDAVLFGETLMYEQPGATVAIVSNPVTAVLCRLLYLQPYEFAQVPVYVATNCNRLSAEHIAALHGRNCIFMPTARQFKQWSNMVSKCRRLLGDIVTVDNTMLCLHSALLNKITVDTDFQFIVLQHFETARHQYNNDTFEFIKSLGGFDTACKVQENNK